MKALLKNLKVLEMEEYQKMQLIMFSHMHLIKLLKHIPYKSGIDFNQFNGIKHYLLKMQSTEQEFSKRNKRFDFFSLMLRKRLKGDEDIELEEEEEGKGKGKKASKAKELTISEMDEWMETSDDDSDKEGEERKEEDEEKVEKKNKNKKNFKNKKKSKKRDTNSEAFEDSDDGDGEGRELDYITDSSDSEPENNKLEGVSEEKGMRKLLNSDEESENDSDKSDKDDDKEEKNDDKSREGGSKEKSKNKVKKEVKREEEKRSGRDSDFSSDSSTDEDIKKKKAQRKAKKGKYEITVKGDKSNRCGSPTSDGKGKLASDLAMPGPSQKKAKDDSLINCYIPGSAKSGITEDAVRKYLMRKPMTKAKLLQKFKSKKTELSSEQLANIMTQILKKINPVKQMLKGKMYLSIKS